MEPLIISLAAARVNRGLSQKEAAQKLKISNKTLCSWEKGHSMPNAKQVIDITTLYGIGYDNINFLPNNPLKSDTEV